MPATGTCPLKHICSWWGVCFELNCHFDFWLSPRPCPCSHSKDRPTQLCSTNQREVTGMQRSQPPTRVLAGHCLKPSTLGATRATNEVKRGRCVYLNKTMAGWQLYRGSWREERNSVVWNDGRWGGGRGGGEMQSVIEQQSNNLKIK